MSTKDIISNNIDAKNRIASSVINKRYNQSALDGIRSKLASVKDSEASKSAIEDGQLAGVLLWERTFPFDIFKNKYENNITLYREITDKGNQGGPGYFVREAYVHIPEMTLMLPYPDFSIINEYFESVDNLKDQKDAMSDTHLEKQKKCEKEFKKIIMYPRFYQVTTSALSTRDADYNSLCLVKSLNKNGLMTESVGKFMKKIQTTL